jgi:hypothetical protein
VSLAKVLFTAALAVVIVAFPAVANAKFTKSASASLPVSSDVLAPPTNVAVRCYGASGRVTITWTATTDTYATGYTVYGQSGPTQSTDPISGRTTTSDSPTQAVPAGTIIWLTTTYKNWTSAHSATVTAPSNCR